MFRSIALALSLLLSAPVLADTPAQQSGKPRPKPAAGAKQQSGAGARSQSATRPRAKQDAAQHSDSAEQATQAAPTAQAGQRTDPASLPPRLKTRYQRMEHDASIVAHTAPAARVTVKGVALTVHGATEPEKRAIETTLAKLPVSHIKALPRIVVAGSGGQGLIKKGGNSVDQATADRLNRAGIHKQMAEAGYPQVARLELTHESFTRARQGVWGTLLHETGHFVDHKFHLTRKIKSEDLGDIAYGGIHRGDGSDSRGPLMERLAEAYRAHWQGSLRDRTAADTMKRLLADIPAQ